MEQTTVNRTIQSFLSPDIVMKLVILFYYMLSSCFSFPHYSFFVPHILLNSIFPHKANGFYGISSDNILHILSILDASGKWSCNTYNPKFLVPVFFSVHDIHKYLFSSLSMIFLSFCFLLCLWYSCFCFLLCFPNILSHLLCLQFLHHFITQCSYRRTGHTQLFFCNQWFLFVIFLFLHECLSLFIPLDMAMLLSLSHLLSGVTVA